MKRAEQRRRRVDSAVPLLRHNPHPWKRGRFPHILIRHNDVNKDIQLVTFLHAEDATRFLQQSKLKRKRQAEMSPTEIQREALRRGTQGF
jgi:hypothetical protein